MPYTKEELKNYDFYQNLKQERDDRYEAAYNEALSGELIKTSVTETDPITGETIISTILVPNPETIPRYKSHLVVSGSNTLFSFEDIDEERRKEAPFGRIGRDDALHSIITENKFPVFEKGERLENTIDTEINSLIPLAPSLPTARLYESPNDNVLEPQHDGVKFTLISPSRVEPNVRTNGYTIDLVNGDIVGTSDWNTNDGFGLNLYYLENNRKRRFPSIDVFQSYYGTLITRFTEEIIIVLKEDLDNILNGKPMQFNTSQ